MPYKPMRPCRHPGCPNLADGPWCKEHLKYEPEYRPSAASRGYSSHWRTERLKFLNKNPLCVKCMERGKVTPATVVDHIKPHRGDKTLFWDRNNWQSLCADCHNEKTGMGL